MIKLEPAMTYRLDVTGPLTASDGSPPDPRRQWWQMTRAVLEGPEIRAASAMPGIDWFSPYPDDYGRPHVRLPFKTEDGALILLEYTGIILATDAFKNAVANDTPTDWPDQYMRMAMVFETESPKYAWLRESLFLARGRLLAAKSLEYDVYRVA